MQLQSSLRNALATFGSQSPQYLSIKSIVDEQAVKVALRDMSLGSAPKNATQEENDDVDMQG